MDALEARWNGPRWRLWSFVAGLASIVIALMIALVIALVTNQAFIPLALLLIVLVILGASIAGSGIIESLTSQMTRGGLARDSAEYVDQAQSSEDLERAEQRNQELRDQRTIRSGLFLLGPIAAFIYLMTIL